MINIVKAKQTKGRPPILNKPNLVLRFYDISITRLLDMMFPSGLGCFFPIKEGCYLILFLFTDKYLKWVIRSVIQHIVGIIATSQNVILLLHCAICNHLGEFDSNSSFHVKQGTTGKVNFCFLWVFLMVLVKFSYRQGHWALGYHSAWFRHFPDIS